ncbi:MAG: hypothetical protein Q9227_005652 [Pyrenula ochraceoflavens]
MADIPRSSVSKIRKRDEKASPMGGASQIQRHRCLDQCHYDKPPSLAYVRSLEEQVEELKKKLAECSTSWPPGEASPDGAKHPPSLIAQASSMSIGSSSDSGRPQTKEHYKETDLSMDADGTLFYHNATSAIHDPPEDSPSASEPLMNEPSPIINRKSSITHVNQPNDEDRRQLLQSAQESRAWEEAVIQNTSITTDVPASTASELLKLHFTWISPMFLFVYRPAFIRGMGARNNGTLTPYFSDTLLQVIYAHTARFLNHPVEQPRHLYPDLEMPKSELGETIMLPPKIFMKRLHEKASQKVGEETQNPSRIPTVQAFLQMSARATAFGLSSQGSSHVR